MSILSSQHHSFDIKLASKFGIERAILIHHFQHWIRINRSKNKNIHESRCWTYQTRKDIQAHFPYWTYESVKYLCESLVEEGVLITRNFNRTPLDRTLWYAFVNEEEFGVGDDQIKEMFTKREKSLMEKGKVPNALGKSPSAIPDTITDTENKDKYVPSANASRLVVFFLEAVKKIKPDFKTPVNLEKWTKEIDRMIRIDKRDPEKIKKLLEWLPTHHFWRKNILSAEKLRLQFDRLELEMALSSSVSVSSIQKNKEIAQSVIEKFPEPVSKNHIQLQHTGILFEYGSVFEEIAFTENGFKDRVLSRLRKMNLPIIGL